MTFATQHDAKSQKISRRPKSLERLAGLTLTPAHQDFLGFVDAGREVGRPAMVWMKLLHQIAVRPRYLARRRALLKSQYLVSLILGDRLSASRTAAPRVSASLLCLTPSGKPAVEIRF